MSGHPEFALQPMGTGSVGVGFRMKDRDNGYLLLMSQKTAKKTLIRIESGVPKTISEAKDGGFIEGVWQKVRIQATRGHIKICVGEEDQLDAEVFS